MIKLLCLFLCPVLIFNSCSSRYILSDDDKSFKDLNDALTAEEAEITLTDGGIIETYYLMIDPDSASYREDGSTTRHNIPTANIYIVTIKDHSAGAWEGLAIGSLITAALSLPGQIAGSGRKSSISFGPILGSLISGLLIGMPIGAATGHSHNYILNKTQTNMTMYVTIEVSGIIDEGQEIITLLRKNKKVSLNRSQIKRIDKRDNAIYLTISAKLYKEHFQDSH